MMTRKHYEALAAALLATRPMSDERFAGGNDAVVAVAAALAADNPRFDRARFLAACNGDR